MLTSLAISFAWILTIAFIVLLTLYLDKCNYYLGFGYYSIIGITFFIITYWLSYIS